MGNRAVITTEEAFESQSGIGIYLHWNGGRDSVRGFLEYCKLRSFRRPENDDYGWARLAQVIGNFMGADGCSVGIDDIKRLDQNNSDNGVYLIKDWEIVGRRFFDGEEQDCYDRMQFLECLDEAQPVDQQLGKAMIESLVFHDKTISSVSWNYQYEMKKRREEGIGCTGFKIGSFYSLNERQPGQILKVVDKTTMNVIGEMDGEEMKLPMFLWKDGIESTLIKDDNGYDRPLDSTKEVIA
jgi:hypothetical protein